MVSQHGYLLFSTPSTPGGFASMLCLKGYVGVLLASRVEYVLDLLAFQALHRPNKGILEANNAVHVTRMTGEFTRA